MNQYGNQMINAILNMAMNNPMLKSNPNAQSMLNVIRSGDAGGTADC